MREIYCCPICSKEMEIMVKPMCVCQQDLTTKSGLLQTKENSEKDKKIKELKEQLSNLKSNMETMVYVGCYDDMEKLKDKYVKENEMLKREITYLTKRNNEFLLEEKTQEEKSWKNEN